MQKEKEINHGLSRFLGLDACVCECFINFVAKNKG